MGLAKEFYFPLLGAIGPLADHRVEVRRQVRGSSEVESGAILGTVRSGFAQLTVFR